MSETKKKNILVGCTGSVATIKLPAIVQNLRRKFPDSAEIRCVLTENAKKFLPEDLAEVKISKVCLFPGGSLMNGVQATSLTCIMGTNSKYTF